MDINRLTDGAADTALPARIQTPCCDTTAGVELAQDFVLPDYLPEIRRLLRVTPTVLPPSRYLGAGEAEFAGGVTFGVLYVGGDGALYGTELSAPYTLRVPLGESAAPLHDAPLQVSADIVAESVTARVSAPRKLHIKCRLRAAVLGLCEQEVAMALTGETRDSATLETLEHVRLCGRTVFAAGEAMELGDELTPAGGTGELRVICCEGTVHLAQVTATAEAVTCSGALLLQLLVTRDVEGDTDAPREAEVLHHRIELSQTVELSPALGGEVHAMAYGVCTSITARVEDDRILLLATVVLQVCAQGSERVGFVSDCYSTARTGACVPCRYTYDRPLACVQGNVSAGGGVSRAEAGVPQDARLSAVTADARLERVACERGRLQLYGTAHYRVLYRTELGEMGVATCSLPLRYEVPADIYRAETDEVAPLRLCGRADLLAARPRIEDDMLVLDAEWAIAALVSAVDTVEAVGEAQFDEAADEARAAYTLYFPAEGESLWSIAKRYRTPLRTLAVRNGLPGAADPTDPASLAGARFVMIGG